MTSKFWKALWTITAQTIQKATKECNHVHHYLVRSIQQGVRFYTLGIFVLTGMMPSHWSIPQVSVSVGQESDVHTVYPEERYDLIECVIHHFSHALSTNVVLVLKFHEFFYERSWHERHCPYLYFTFIDIKSCSLVYIIGNFYITKCVCDVHCRLIMSVSWPRHCLQTLEMTIRRQILILSELDGPWIQPHSN